MFSLVNINILFYNVPKEILGENKYQMWERKDLKEKARKSLKKNYWTLVIGCFIIAICTGEFGLASASFEKNYESN